MQCLGLRGSKGRETVGTNCRGVKPKSYPLWSGTRAGITIRAMRWTPSAQDSEQYQRDGYFVRPGIVSADDVAAIRKAITDALDASDHQHRGNFDEELSARHGAQLVRRQRY